MTEINFESNFFPFFLMYRLKSLLQRIRPANKAFYTSKMIKGSFKVPTINTLRNFKNVGFFLTAGAITTAVIANKEERSPEEAIESPSEPEISIDDTNWWGDITEFSVFLDEESKILIKEKIADVDTEK